MTRYDAWLQSDIAFDEFHGLIPDDPEPPDYITEWRMEKLREKYHIGENDGKVTEF